MTLKGVSVFTNRAVQIEIEGKMISRIETIEDPKQDLPYISPGFLDMQVNGYRGSDYSNDDFSEDHMLKIIRYLAQSGTTQHVPTIVTSPEVTIVRNLKIIAKVIRENPEVGEAVSGIHIEGPFISAEDGPRGAHDLGYVRIPDFQEFQRWQEAAEGRINLVTVAPETKGALELIRRIVKSGVTVAIGHSGADPDVIWKAIEAGAKISTHLGNGSYTQIPRLKNYIWEQLAADELVAGIISDGFHLPASVVKVFARAKGLERIILVSDVAPLGGFEPGVYKWGNIEIQMFEDGHLGLPGTTILGGAAFLLDRILVSFMEFTGTTLGDTIRLCTVNPGRALGLAASYGRLSVGSPANLCLFRYREGERQLAIEKSVCAGREIYVK